MTIGQSPSPLSFLNALNDWYSPASKTLSETNQLRKPSVWLSIKPSLTWKDTSHTSSILTLSTGIPQGCVLSPLLYALFMDDCQPIHNSNTIVKFADDNLILNTKNTKEVIVDFRTTKKMTHSHVHINTDAVRRVPSFRFLRVTIIEDLSWADNTSAVVGKTQHRLYFLRSIRRANLPQKAACQLLQMHHRELT